MAGEMSVQDLLASKEKELLETWMTAQTADAALRADLLSVDDLRKQSIEFLRAFVQAMASGNLGDIAQPEYAKVRDTLKSISKSRATQGFTPSETAAYIFSLKDSILELLQAEFGGVPDRLNTEVIRISKLLDKLGLITFEEYTRGREETVKEQQKSILEMSSPIVTLWEKILAVPIIGLLDSRRTQQIMEELLQTIVQTGSKVAVIDITGVGVMDTLVSTHLIKTASAVKLLGAEAVITGIRPEVAQTVVHLGVDLGGLVTRASMADGLAYAFTKLGLHVVEKKTDA
ncbi:MAG: STAS domain-containing protein [Planctomycetes bacterium]|nr:STAS domain-containing protein [Planctomycetota bacterium]MBL7040196.1 STAS domain-containing protein [Pirellulaceae bacterium]